MDKNFFWLLTLKDGSTINIKPELVSIINTKIANRQDIVTPTRTIMSGEVMSFKMTDKLYSKQQLLDSVSQMFNTPVDSPEGGVYFRWIKRAVPNERWARHYSHLPAYKRLQDDGSMITMAYKMPVHQVDVLSVSYCTDDEILKLERS